MKRFAPILTALAIMLTAFTACDREIETSSGGSELVVSGGGSIPSLEEKAPLFPLEINGVTVKAEAKRVVSLSPAVTEIIAELGYADRLVGVSSYCDYPEGLSASAVGSPENPDLKAIESLKPDVVITISRPSERDVYSMEDMGAAVLCLSVPTSVEELGALYGNIASAFEGAEKAGERSEAAVKKLTDLSKNAFSGSFIYVTAKKTVAGTGTVEGGILSLCGGNLCSSEGYISASELGEISPDYIIAADSLRDSGLSSDETLAALINGGAKVIYVPSVRFERPSLRISEVFSAITEQLSE